ncbi:hypothetical protein J6590_107796 [Homalodisca vitripennis]|nr:hypothetical protein J6590_107796 [Homalodisca vitripennis]
MASGTKNPICGACPKKVTSTSGGLRCEGNCMKWFHFKCAGKSKKDFSFSKDEKSNFVCDSCKRLEQRERTVSDSSNLSEKVECNCSCDCIVHIRILTDQIFDLTKNMRELQEQIRSVQSDNVKLSSVLQGHTEAIGDFLTRPSDSERVSYSGILKSTSKNTNSFYPMIDSNNENRRVMSTSGKSDSLDRRETGRTVDLCKSDSASDLEGYQQTRRSAVLPPRPKSTLTELEESDSNMVLLRLNIKSTISAPHTHLSARLVLTNISFLQVVQL